MGVPEIVRQSRVGSSDPEPSAAPTWSARQRRAEFTVLTLDVDAALTALASSRNGLSESEVLERRRTSGANSLPPHHRRSVLLEFATQFANMFAVILAVAAGLTFLTYFASVPRNVANLELAFGIVAVIVLNAVIGFVQEHSAERTAEALQDMVPHMAKVLRQGELCEVRTFELVPGDVVVLEAGDTVAADCRLVESHDLFVEMATLTGESQPVTRSTDPVPASTPLVEAPNVAVMGATVTNGTGKGVVFATGLSTEFGHIYQLTESQPSESSPLQRQVTNMARRVAAVAISVGGLIFLQRVVSGNPAALSFIFALGVMVALVPEGLPATLSVSLAIGVRRMARHQALIRRLTAVEALGSTTVICTDKTGTLTKAEMTLETIYASGGFHAVSGVGYAPEGEVHDLAVVKDLLRVAALCSDARLVPPTPTETWRILGDTTEGAILVAAAKAGIDRGAEEVRTPRVGVFPFDADRKIMTTLHQDAHVVRAYVKGSPEAVTERCTRVRINAHDVALDESARRDVADADDAMARQGLRVLAVAIKDEALVQASRGETESELTLLGLVGIFDPPRPEVAAAVSACRDAGIGIYMVTGDYGLTAEAIARRVGIIDEGPLRIVTGAQLDTTSPDELTAILSCDEQIVFARVRPEHKLRIVDALEGLGEIVAVTGDGANDAPALKRASVGIAMGQGGTDVARSAAVMVLLDDSFASIVAAIQLGRAVYQNIRRFLIYVFTSNLGELAPILVATFVGFPLVPLTALQVLAIDLGTDVLPALALGAERPERDVMSRPPRPPREHLFSWDVVRRILFLGTLQSVGVVVAFFWRIHSAHLGFGDFTSESPAYREALTMTQASIVVSQFFISFAVRSDRQSLRRTGLFTNPALVGAGLISLSFITAVSYVPLLQRVFHTAPLTTSDWLIIVAFGVFLLVADEARKAWHRGRDASSATRPRGPRAHAATPPDHDRPRRASSASRDVPSPEKERPELGW